jgi:putative transcriptional regulator
VATVSNWYGMTDRAIAQELGLRLEQRRLAANKPQKELAQELGIAEGTYRNAIQGKAKLEVLIGIMRLLGCLDELDNFLPPQPFSPMALLKLEGKKRQRAGSRRRTIGDEAMPRDDEELTW